MQGWIKDYRQELDSAIWQMPPLYHRVWQWLKYQVNHADAEIPLSDGTKIVIRKGQHLTSVRNIAQGIGWYEGPLWKEPNPKTIAKILDWLTKNKMIEIDRGRGNRQYTLISLVKWDVFQANDSQGVTANGEGTGEPREQLVDINKNVKNKENEKKEIREYITLPSDAHIFLNIYLQEFRDMLEKDHPKVTEEQYQFIMDNLERLDEYDTSVQEFTEQVQEHFLHLPESNNGSILPFIYTFRRRFEVPHTGQDY